MLYISNNIIGKLFIIFSSIIILISSILYYYSTTQNIYNGHFKIKNSLLKNPIYIYTDKNGFTHIKAKNKKDAFFGIGILHARDRLFQMDMLRRFSSGRLSEILGKKTLEIDKLMRIIGLKRISENDVLQNSLNKNHSEINNLLSMYIEGINYWANSHKLPIEYYLLNFNFENWTIIDSFVVFRFMEFNMICDHSNELLNHLIHDILGEDFYNLLYKSTLFDFPYFNDTIINKDEIKEMKLNNENNINKYLFNIENIPKINYKVSSINESDEISFEKLDEHASNSWVISGNFTNTSKPIFSNDPHLGNSIPGVHYIAKLYIENNNKEDDIYFGSFIPGSPFSIIGGNKYFAYGFTTDNRDKSDFVEEKLDNDDISKAKFYYVDNEKIPLENIHEIIKVKGIQNYEFEVKLTRNGPIIPKYLKEISKIGFDYIYNSTNKKISNALSLNVYGFKKVFNILFYYNIMFGKSKEDFLNVLDNYVGPSFSFTWANKNGEIGYTPIGTFMIKNNISQIFSKGYNSSLYDINNIKIIPRNETPVLINPKRGFIVTANNIPTPINYIYPSSHYTYPFRFHKINQLINETINKKKFTVEDSIKILSDTHDSLCEFNLPKLYKILKKHISSSNKVYNYFEMLNDFDCNFNKTSRVATLYAELEYQLIKNLLIKNEKNNVKGFKNRNEVKSLLFFHTLFYSISKIIDSVEKNDTLINFSHCKVFNKNHNCEEYIVDIFNRIDIFLKEDNLIEIVKYNGKDYEITKKWGDVIIHDYSHLLGQNKFLKWIFSRENPTEGNRNTIKVAKNSFSKYKNPFTSVHSANLKYINDLSDISRPFICMDTGNSGNIFSKYYDNLIKDCEENKLIKFENHIFSMNENDEIIISSE